MKYGDIYEKVPAEILNKIVPINSIFLIVGRLYFKFFGYPDIAGFGRFLKIVEMLSPHKNEKILDAGCGNGIYANSLAYYFHSKLTACDLDKRRIETARKVAGCLKIDAKFEVGDIESLNYPNKTFNKIICIEVIEHIRNDTKLIKKFSSLLKKNGILVFSTSHKENWGRQKEKEFFQGVKKGEHVRSGYEFKELKNILEKNSFKILKYDLYYQYFSRIVIKIQQKLYKNNLVLLNLITFPLFILISKLDNLLPLNIKKRDNIYWYRGFIIKAVKI